MPDGEQMNPFLLHVESVNDPIVAHASSNACALAHLNKKGNKLA
jgi:hypothetical protein